MTVRVILQDVNKIEIEALIVVCYEDVRPLKGVAGALDWFLCGSFSALILARKIRGSLGEMALVTSQGKLPVKKIFLVGLGPRAGLSRETLRSAARNAAESAVGAGVRSAALEYVQPDDLSTDTCVSALQLGLEEGSAGRDFEVVLLAPDAAAYDRISRSLSIGHS